MKKFLCLISLILIVSMTACSAAKPNSEPDSLPSHSDNSTVSGSDTSSSGGSSQATESNTDEKTNSEPGSLPSSSNNSTVSGTDTSSSGGSSQASVSQTDEKSNSEPGSLPSSSDNSTVSGSDTSSSDSGSSQETESKPEYNSESQSEKSDLVAAQGVRIQTDDPNMPTRVMESGTKINMHFGDTVITGILNDSETAKALIEMLPYTVKNTIRYSSDLCGVMQDRLPYNEDELHYGWLNGDIDYSVHAPYFTILHSDEESSGSYYNRVNIGVVTCELSKLRSLNGSYDVLIELA